MYIISKFKDYYDGVVGSMGIDKTLVYERHEKVITSRFPRPFERASGYFTTPKNDLEEAVYGLHNKYLRESNLVEYPEYRYTNSNWGIHSFIIGFCGGVYVGWNIQKLNSTPYVNELMVSYDHPTIEKLTQPTYTKESVPSLVKKVESADLMHIHREYNTPIFVYEANGLYRKYGTHNPVLVINPTLKNYDFFRIIDSFTAFQEIQMFVGGVLGRGENETIEISDKNKIEQHGFDYKWSFRKEPTKKRNNVRC
jgi:hypothetical protein